MVEIVFGTKRIEIIDTFDQKKNIISSKDEIKLQNHNNNNNNNKSTFSFCFYYLQHPHDASPTIEQNPS